MTTTRTALNHAVQELDEKIVEACNELMRLKAYTPQQRVRNINEKNRLRKECEQRELQWKERLRKARLSQDSSCHQQVRDHVFADLPFPAIVASRQAQLLLGIHMMEVLANQTELLQKDKRNEYLQLEDDMNGIQLDQCRNSQQQLQEILALERQIKELGATLASYPQRTADPSTSILVDRSKHSTESVEKSSDDSCSSDESSAEPSSPLSLSSPLGKARLLFRNPFALPGLPLSS